MREVEQRLGEEDTGEQTRKKQEEIVKDLEQLIKLARQAARNQQRQRGMQQAGQRNQGQEQANPDNPREGTGPMKPRKPTARSILAENKDIWGHLPPELRREIDNLFNEDALPKRRTLIDRYFLSINRKSTGNREEP
jgi:hypothetical protein